MKLRTAQPETTATTPRHSRNLRFGRRAWSSIRAVWTAGIVTACGGGVSGYTLYLVAANNSWSGTTDDGTVEFTFCQSENLYCDPTDSVVTPANSGFDVVGGTVAINVSLGYTPTAVKISNPSGNSWEIGSVMWNDEEGSDLLGSDSTIYLDQEIGEDGCTENGVTQGGHRICSLSWVFFNVDGSSNEYKVGVEACAGTSSASVDAYFCSNLFCDGTIGDEVEVSLTMSDEEGGWTYTTFSADFNPVAVRLVEVEDQNVTWCAETVSYNFFTVIEGISSEDFEIDENGEASVTVQNIQNNGYSTPAPTTAPTFAPISESPEAPITESPEAPITEGSGAPISESLEAPISADVDDSSSNSRWRDATWEIMVTVVAALVVAGGAMLFKWWMSRRDFRSCCCTHVD